VRLNAGATCVIEWPGEEKLAKIGKPFLAACAPPGTYPPAPTSPGDDRMWHCHGANYAELVSNLQSESSLTLLLCPPRLPPPNSLCCCCCSEVVSVLKDHELNPVTTYSNLHSLTLPPVDRSLRNLSFVVHMPSYRLRAWVSITRMRFRNNPPKFWVLQSSRFVMGRPVYLKSGEREIHW
jgi:hypothetical protein